MAMRAFFIIGFLLFFSACHPSDTNAGSDNKSKNTASPIPTKQRIDCSSKLTHANPDISKAYEESFKHLGIFLLYYQQKLLEAGEPEAVKYMVSLDPFGIQPFQPPFFDQVKDLSTKEIDSRLTNDNVRKIWQNWCRYPANFICNLLKSVNYAPLSDKSPKNIEDIFIIVNPYNLSNDLMHWLDDGLWGMQTIIFGKNSAGLEENDMAHADPSKWCY